MIDLRMPRLSDSMEQGTILTWLKAEGEPVRRGDELAEIETDKATVAYDAEQEGRLQIVVQAGATAAVGEVIARLADDPADGSSRVALAASGAITSDPGPAAPELRDRAPGGATPLARRVAAAHGLALAQMTGSGPGGRVTRGDVLARLGLEPPEPFVDGGATASAGRPAAEPPRAPAVPSPSATDPVRGEIEFVTPSRLQATVARRMTETKATVPEFGVAAEVAVDAVLELRAQMKRSGLGAPSLNDFIVKAAALALREHPRANAAYRDGRFELYGRVNVGIAVAAPDALVVATITDADTRSLASIAAESRRLAARVRDGAATPAELSGATFTVSNLGMYGMSHITPIINAGQAAILGVGVARPVLARRDGEIVERTLMTLTLTCDHRILYGADAARLLSDIRDRLENPLRLSL